MVTEPWFSDGPCCEHGPDRIEETIGISETRSAIVESAQGVALGPIASPDSVSQQITRLIGTDDWAILHSGHQLVTAEDLDDMEVRGGVITTNHSIRSEEQL